MALSLRSSIAKRRSHLNAALAVQESYQLMEYIFMEQKSGKPQLKESNDNLDLIRMQTEVALVDSMTKSKTLTIMVVVGALAFSGFAYFLYKMAGMQ
ncbi:hypothetical protein [Pseudoalteromonas undina]|uniref:Uncharacterized protein n=2 Tax=Pseudoalteromonas TaxID=53246 RepID=A0ABN0NL09_9GAMM|nr:hypothetical protein [Pseudoalteromonas undina]